MDIQKIKDKIAKLLRMAKDSSSPNEAAIAASRARKLMDEHQITEFDVESNEANDMITMPATRAFAASMGFIETLAIAVAQFNDCHARKTMARMDHRMDTKVASGVTPKQWGHQIIFQGRSDDVELACMMLDNLVDSINTQCKTYMQAAGHTRYNVRLGSEFKLGAAVTLSVRLGAIAKERDKMRSGGRALVLMKMDAVDKEFGPVSYRTADLDPENLPADAIIARLRGHFTGQNIQIQQELDKNED